MLYISTKIQGELIKTQFRIHFGTFYFTIGVT